MADSDHTGRKMALVGGTGLVAWWLLSRGKGWGFRGPDSADAGQSAARCTVWIRADRIEVDGVTADVATVIAKCRAVGRAEVHATGDAITRVVHEVLAKLRAAGVSISVPPDLANVVPSELLS